MFRHRRRRRASHKFPSLSGDVYSARARVSPPFPPPSIPRGRGGDGDEEGGGGKREEKKVARSSTASMEERIRESERKTRLASRAAQTVSKRG